jgi:streptogramin lyase
VFRSTVFTAACSVAAVCMLAACGGAGSSSGVTPLGLSTPQSTICDGFSRSGRVPAGSCQTPAPAPAFTTYSTPDGLHDNAVVLGIIAGPHNTAWFADDRGAVGYASATSTPHINEAWFLDSRPIALVYDKTDGHIWFTQSDNKLGEIDPNSRSYVAYDIGTSISSVLFASSIVADPKGRLWIGIGTSWVDDTLTNLVVRFDPVTHTSVTFTLAGFYPIGEAFGADGNLWIAEGASAQVEVMQTAGASAGKILQTITLPNSSPQAIALGPDGNMWVADGMGAIWRITPNGSTQKFSVPGCQVNGIASDSLRKVLWFTTYNCKPLNKITTTGVVTSWASPGSNAAAVTIAENNDVWYTSEGNPPSIPSSLVRAVP